MNNIISDDELERIAVVSEIIRVEEIPDKAWIIFNTTEFRSLVPDSTYSKVESADVNQEITLRDFSYEKLCIGMQVMVRATYHSVRSNNEHTTD